MSVPISPLPINFSIGLVQFRQRSNCISITKVSVNYVIFYIIFSFNSIQKTDSPGDLEQNLPWTKTKFPKEL